MYFNTEQEPKIHLISPFFFFKQQMKKKEQGKTAHPLLSYKLISVQVFSNMFL